MLDQQEGVRWTRVLLWSTQIQSLLEPAAESETCLRVTRSFTHKLEEQMVSGFAGEWMITEKPWWTKFSTQLNDATRCLDAELITS